MSKSQRSPTPLRSQLLWLITLRVAIVTMLLGAGILAQIRAQGMWPVDPFFFLLGLTYGLTVIYSLTLALADRHRWLIDLQFGLDTIIISALVLMTGGVTSFFSTLYALPIVAASALQYRRGGILVGLLSSVLYAGLILAQYSGTFGLMQLAWLPVAALPPIRVALYTMGLGVFGFIAVAVLSGYLAERVRRADARLQRASSQIADLQAFNQHVIESLRNGLATTDQLGYVLTFNPSAEQITGWDSADAIGRSIFELVQLPAESRRSLRADDSGGQGIEVLYTRPGGDRIELSLSAAPLIIPSGDSGFLFVFEDVTDARRLEKESRLQQRLAAVGEMAAGIAHEIRNPLASMSGSIQILRQELPLSDDQERLMDIVLRESERLNETIRAFLAYARPRRFETERLDLRRVVGDTALLLQHSSEFGEAHTVEVDVPPGPVWYEADENQMRQIVWNLASNALHAMPKGGRLQLSAGCHPAGGALVRVADQGVGIPADEIGEVFQPFRSSFEKGTGLGLAIVHRIVSDYGGEVQINSEEGAGTTVSVCLPAKSVAAPPAFHSSTT